MATPAMAMASAELTLPSRKLTLSRSISLRAFCTAVAASPEVEVLDQKFGLTAENAALGVDLLDGELAADQFVLADRGVGAGQRIIEADLDFVGRPLVTTKGEAICATPASAAVLITVRRSMRLENKSEAIVILPGLSSTPIFLEGNPATSALTRTPPAFFPSPRAH